MLWPVAVLGGVAGAVLVWPLGLLPGVAVGALVDRRLGVHDFFDLQERLAGRDELQVDALLLMHAMGWLLADCASDGEVRRRREQLLQSEARIAGLAPELARRAWLQGERHARLQQLHMELRGRPLRRDYLLRTGWRLLWLDACPPSGRARLEALAELLQSPPGRLHALEQAVLGRGRLTPLQDQAWLAALEVLGMPLDSSEQQLRQAYRRLLSRWHPDRHHAAGAERVDLATERTRQIRAAWDLICQRNGWR